MTVLLGVAALLPAVAKAGSASYNGSGSWQIEVATAVSFSSTVYDSTVIVTGGGNCLIYDLTSPGGASDSASEPAGTWPFYNIQQIVSYGVPGAFATTNVSW